jgi:NitT/TauT family transport system substrate-binding protein
MQVIFGRIRALLTAVAVFVCALLPSHASAQAQVVRVALSLTTYSNLPIFLAADKGYFRDAGLDVQLSGFGGSSTAQIPRLARGDTDMLALALGPAFFNQFSGGFNIKLLATLEAQRTGWNATSWLVVRQDLWDSKAIRQPKDLRGKIVDGAAEGSPLDLLALTTIQQGGLTLSDVHYSQKFRDPPNWLTAFRNKAVDVQGLPEPIATEMDVQKIAHKWIGLSNVAPWFNEEFIAASPSFARDHHDVVVRFLRAYLRAVRDVQRSRGRWTPELVTCLAKWTSLPESTIRQIPGPAYPGDGSINNASVAHQEDFWHDRGLVTTIVPPGAFIDSASLSEAMTRGRGGSSP